jgi:hypothetical protein
MQEIYNGYKEEMHLYMLLNLPTEPVELAMYEAWLDNGKRSSKA